MMNDYRLTLSHEISLLPWLENICQLFSAHSLGHTPLEGQQWPLETSALPPSGQVCTHIHFMTEQDCDQMSAFLTSQHIAHQKENKKIAPWQEYHQQFMEPLNIGALTIQPLRAPEILDAHTLYFPAGLGFGTGHHETTQGCLSLMQQCDLTESCVLDFGSGSGILCVAAGLLGAKQLYYHDIDPQALEATEENLGSHQLSHKATQVHTTQIPSNLDLIVSNILLAPLIEQVSFFAQKLKTEGILITSGVLEDQQEELERAYEPFFIKIKADNNNGWLSHLWKKK